MGPVARHLALGYCHGLISSKLCEALIYLGIGFLALHLGVALAELLNSACGVEDLLLTSVKRVRSRGDININHGVGVAILPFDGVRRFERGPCQKGKVRRDVTEHDRPILRVDVFLHSLFNSYSRVNTCGVKLWWVQLHRLRAHGLRPCAKAALNILNLNDNTSKPEFAHPRYTGHNRPWLGAAEATLQPTRKTLHC